MKWLFRKASKAPKASKLPKVAREQYGASKRLQFPKLKGFSKKPRGGTGKGPPLRKRRESEDDCTSEFQFQFFTLQAQRREMCHEPHQHQQQPASRGAQRPVELHSGGDSGFAFSDLTPTSVNSAPVVCSGSMCAGRCPTCHSMLLHRRRDTPLPPRPALQTIDLRETADSGVYDEIPGSPSACMRAGQAACRKRKRDRACLQDDSPLLEAAGLCRKRARRHAGLPPPLLLPPPLPPHRTPLASMLRHPMQIFDRDSLDRSPTPSEKVLGSNWLEDEYAYSPVYDIYDEPEAKSLSASNCSLETALRAGDEVKRLREFKTRELPYPSDDLERWVRREMEVFREQLLLRVRRASLGDYNLLPCIETDL